MKAKTYRAKDIQQALDRIKAELGPDAIILSTQKLERRRAFGLIRQNCWEVTAGSNESRKSAETQQPRPKSPAARASNGPEPAPIEKQRPKPDAPAELPPQVSARLESSDARFEKLLKEVHSLKRSLQQISRTIPSAAQDLSGPRGELLALGLEQETVDQLLTRASDGDPGDDELRQRMRQELTELFHVETPVELLGRARAISVFVGPSGVGKTTAVAKLAGHARAVYKKRVTMISMDQTRIGGAGQLAEYGQLMDIPVFVCPDVAALEKLLGHLDDDLILIDTPGANPLDKSSMDAIRAITALANMRAHVVISAATRADEISGIVSAFAGNGPKRALITKRDEVTAPGALLAQALRIELPISYVSNGPNVPEDLACPGADELAGQMLPALPLETVEAAS